MVWVLDLDGVVWRAEQPIEGAAEAVGALRAAGERVIFVTNNSAFRVAEQEAKLAALGIEAEGDVVTSGMAAASLLAPGSTALLCAGPGVEEALVNRHIGVTRDGTAEAVVAGWHRDFDYERLTAAFRAIVAGARFVATNDDPTYPTPEGAIPGGGAIVAAIATAAGVRPEIAGKPYEPMARLVRGLAGEGPGVVVGDRPSTDGEFARRMGMRFGLVLTGVTGTDDLPVQPGPDVVAADLRELVARELGSG